MSRSVLDCRVVNHEEEKWLPRVEVVCIRSRDRIHASKTTYITGLKQMAASASSAAQEASSVGYDTGEDEDVNVASMMRDKPATMTSDPAEMMAIHMMQYMERQVKEHQEQVSSTEPVGHPAALPLPASTAHLVLPSEPMPATTAATLAATVPPVTQSLLSPMKETGLTAEDYLQLIRQQMMTTPVKHGGGPALADDYLSLPRLLDSPIKDQYARPAKDGTHAGDEVLYSRQTKDQSHTSDDVMQMINMMEEVVCEQQSQRSVTKETASPPPDTLATQLNTNQMLQMAAPVLDSAPAQVALSSLKDFNVKDLLSLSLLRDYVPAATFKDYVSAGMLKDANPPTSAKDAGGSVYMPAAVAAAGAALPMKEYIPVASSGKGSGTLATAAKDYIPASSSNDRLPDVTSQSQLAPMLHSHLAVTSSQPLTSHPAAPTLLPVSATHTLPHIMHLAPPRDQTAHHILQPTVVETIKDLNQVAAVLKDYHPGVGHIGNMGHLAYYPVASVNNDSRNHTPQPTDYSQAAPVQITSMMLPVTLEPGQVREHGTEPVSQDHLSVGKFPLPVMTTRLVGDAGSVNSECDTLAQDLTVATHHAPSSHDTDSAHQSTVTHPMSALPLLIAKQVEELRNAEQEMLASRAGQVLLGQYVKLESQNPALDHVLNFMPHALPATSYAPTPHRENPSALPHEFVATQIRRELGVAKEPSAATTSDYIAATVRHELSQDKDRMASEDFIASMRHELTHDKDRLTLVSVQSQQNGDAVHNSIVRLSSSQLAPAAPPTVLLTGDGHLPSIIDATNVTALRYISLEKHGLDDKIIQEDWLVKFPWLVLNLSSNIFICRVCQQAHVTGNFASGVSTSTPLQKDFAAHELSIQHKEAGIKLNFSLDDIDFGFEKDKEQERPLVIDIKPSGAVSEMDISSKVKDIVERLKSPKHPIPQEWFTKFQWLKYDTELELFFCKICIKQRQTNPFTAGKSIPSPKRESFAVHEDCYSHKLAVLVDLGVAEDVAKAAIMKESGTSAQRNLTQELNTHPEQSVSLPTSTSCASKTTSSSSIPMSAPVKDNDVKAAAERFFTFCAEFRGPHKRQIQVEWFIQFPWLELDINKKCFMCKFCRFYNPQGVFGTGKLIDEPRQDDLRKHGQTDAHAIAMKAYSMDPAAGNHPALHAETSGLIDVGLVMKYSNYVKQPSSKVTTPVFLEFPWLQYEDAARTYYCLLCREQREKCTISKGTVSTEQLFSHESLAHHKMALVKFEEKARQLMDYQQLQSSVLNPAPASDLNMLPWRDAFWQFANQARSMGILCDVTLNIKEENNVIMAFHVHKLLLVCASEYFQMLLREKTINDQYTLEGMTAKGLEGILNFMYGQPVGVEPRYYLDCLQAAALLMIPQAQKYFQHLLMSFSVAKVQQAPQVEDISTYTKDMNNIASSGNEDDGEDTSMMTDEFDSTSDYESTPAKVAKWTEHSHITDSVRVLEQAKLNEQAASAEMREFRASATSFTAEAVKDVAGTRNSRVSVSAKQAKDFDQIREPESVRLSAGSKLSEPGSSIDVSHYRYSEPVEALESRSVHLGKRVNGSEQCEKTHVLPVHRSHMQQDALDSEYQKSNEVLKSFRPHAFVQKFAEEVSNVTHAAEEQTPVRPESLNIHSSHQVEVQEKSPVMKTSTGLRCSLPQTQRSKENESLARKASENSASVEQLPLTSFAEKTLTNGLSDLVVSSSIGQNLMTPVIQSIGYSVNELIHTALGNNTKLPVVAGSTSEISPKASVQSSSPVHAAVANSKLNMESDAESDDEDREKLVIALTTVAVSSSGTSTVVTASAKQARMSTSVVQSSARTSNGQVLNTSQSEQPVFPVAVAATTPSTLSTSIVAPSVAASAPTGLDLTPVSNVEATVTQSVAKSLDLSDTLGKIRTGHCKGAKGKAKAAAAAAVAAAAARNNAKKTVSRPYVRRAPRVVTDIEKLKLPGNIIRSEPAPLPTPDEQTEGPAKPVLPQYEHATERKREVAEYLPTCDICGKKFLRKGCIQRHKDKHHAEVKKKVTFKCDRCPKECPTRHDLKLHIRVHTGERPFKCSECDKTFTRRETLTEHEFTHKPDSEKPHQCPGCGKGFFKMHDLQRHYTGLHSGDRPFQCHQCGKAFPWARSLQDHLSAHQGSDRRRPYKCVDCDMTFVRKYDLNRHAITHTKEKPFVCEWCGHAFTQKGSMDKHKREFCRGRPGEERPGEAKPTVGLPEGSDDFSIPIPATNQNELDPSAALIFYSV